MEERRRAFVKAFPIPHLENNSFLYADLPPSFQVPPPKPIEEKRENKEEGKKQEEQSLKEVKPIPVITEDRSDTADTQVSTTRTSTACQLEPRDKPRVETNLLAECKRLIANVNAMKKRRHHAEDRSTSASPVAIHSKPATPVAVPAKAQAPMPRLSLDDPARHYQHRPASNCRRQESYEIPQDVCTSFATPVAASYRKDDRSLGMRGDDQRVTLVKRPERRSVSRDKVSVAGMKSNMGYLKEVYTVIEQHAKHCQDLKKDLKRLKSEFESNLSKMK